MAITERNYYYSVQSGDVLEIILKKHGIRKADGTDYRDYYHDEEAWDYIRRNPTENDEFLKDPQIWRGNPHATYGTVHLKNWDSTRPTSEPSPSLKKGADYIRLWCKSDLNPPASALVDWFWDNTYKRYRCPAYNASKLGSLIVYGGERIWIPQETQQIQPQPPVVPDRTKKDGKLEITPDYDKRYQLTFPSFKIVINPKNVFPDVNITPDPNPAPLPMPYPNITTVTQKLNKNEAKLKLIGTQDNGNIVYSKTITLLDAMNSSGTMPTGSASGNSSDIVAKFRGTPKDDNIKFKLEVDPGTNEQGAMQDKYVAFSGVNFSEVYSV